MARREDLPFADQAVAAALQAPPARVMTDCVFRDAKRIVHLQYLDRGILGVGHMALYGRETVAIRVCPHAAGQGLVVDPGSGISFAAKDDVVHRALRGRRDAFGDRPSQCAEHDIDDALAGLDVAGRDRRAVAGIDERAGRCDECDGLEDGCRLRRVRGHQAAEAIKHTSGGHGQRAVHGTPRLERGAGEVHCGPLARNGHADPDGQRP